MISSTEFKSNPELYVFLPIYYLIWSDAVLTPGEIKLIKDFIDEQSWVTTSEKDFLKGQLNPSASPSSDELKRWLEEIRQATDHEVNPHLFDIGTHLVKKHSDKNIFSFSSAKESFAKLEESIGIISHESVYSFYPEKRKTITQIHSTQSELDVDQLTALLDGKNAGIIRKVKTILADPSFAYIETDSLREYRQKVLEWCQLLAQQGLGNIAYPKEFGGQGDMRAYFAVMETLSYHDLSLVVKFGVQFGLWGMSIFFLGTEKHHRKYLKDIGTLDLPGCFAMTETGHGSNVRGVETTATYNHQHQTFTIHTPHEQARKEYIGNAALHGQMATVFAKLIIDGKDYGVTAFVVTLRDKNGKTEKGITIKDCGRKLGLNGVDNGVIQFDHVVIPKENMLDRFASVNEQGQFESPIASDNRRFFTMLGTLVGGRIGIPRAGLSAAKSGLTIAIRYGDQRKQFGPEGGAEVPILNYRTHQRRLMPLLANTYALHFSLQYLTERFLNRSEKDMQEIEALAAGLKAFSTWNTTHTLQECREACGGKGYLFENRIGTLKNDSDIFTTFEGDNTVLMQLVAKSRLSEFKQEFSHMNLFGMLNYLADQAATSIAEKNPFATRNTDEEHLLDFEFYKSAFEYRERDILISAAKRLKRLIGEGMDSFDAFNVSQHHLLQVGFAHIERVILEQFIHQVEATEDSAIKAALKQLCQLFALSQIENNKAWYLESGYMEPAKTKAIRKLVNQLCWDIRQHAVPLVNAFGIPDNLLSAPIAR
jgi:acyl-CoA oxidase